MAILTINYQYLSFRQLVDISFLLKYNIVRLKLKIATKTLIHNPECSGHENDMLILLNLVNS
jgi:hypothetical protein